MTFVPFDVMAARVEKIMERRAPDLASAAPLFLVRDLHGRVRVSVSSQMETDEGLRENLALLAVELHEALGVRAYHPDESVLFVDPSILDSLEDTARVLRDGFFWADRVVTGERWWTVSGRSSPAGTPRRFTLYSVKGGVGRTTTTAVLALHLARQGRDVLVVDLDLESPGVSSAVLEESAQPTYGVVDWFVESLVGQGGVVLDDMVASPRWAQDLEGNVHVVPAHGREPGEYLAKLGRVCMDYRDPWTTRLRCMLREVEQRCEPDTVIIESRNGLHDIAAATVTDLDAQVLLFGTDSASTWQDYAILFRHWLNNDLARRIRERLSMVSALTPETNAGPYLRLFRERSWTLFQKYLYDELPARDDSEELPFSFDLQDDLAPHDPLPIYWTRGLSSGSSLQLLEREPVAMAYSDFFSGLSEALL